MSASNIIKDLGGITVNDAGQIVFPAPVIVGSGFYGTSVTQAISSNQDDFTTAGINEAMMVRVDVTGNLTFTGMEAPAPEGVQFRYLVNVGGGNLALKDNDAGSLAANRLLIGSNKRIQGDEGIIFLYDNISNRWRAAGINI